MRGYARNDVEEYDEYDDYGCEDEEEYEEDEVGEEENQEQERKPTEEELEYLELRKRLKERYRKNIKKENGLASSKGKTNRLPYDNYGSFFGPSQPVISQRVIQESKSLLETQHLACRVQNSHRNKERTSASSTSRIGVERPPPKVNEVQRKVQTLKVSRDYSFLSDDAQLPASRQEPPARNSSILNSEARLAHIPSKSKLPLANGGQNVHGAHEERKPVSSENQMHSRAGLHKSTTGSKPISTSVDRKQHSSNSGIGPGRPTGSKVPPSKMPMASMERKAYALDARNHFPSSKNHLPSSKNHVPSVKSQLSSAKNQTSGKILPSSANLPSVHKKHLEHRKTMQEPNRGRPVPKQPVASSKPQINKPLKQISSRATVQDNPPKKKPFRRHSDDDDDKEAFAMLRNLLGSRPAGRYDDDDDVSDMEAGFDDIMEEEKISAKIAKEEDAEQLRLIEEEEREERMRKLARKRKLMNRR